MAPFALLAAATLLPRPRGDKAEAVAEGWAEEPLGRGNSNQLRMKQTGVVAASTLLCTGMAGFRAGAAWARPRPPTETPAWFHRRPAFYVFVFSLELLALGLLTAARVDRLFWVPDRCRGPGDYARGAAAARAAGSHASLDGAAAKHESPALEGLWT